MTFLTRIPLARRITLDGEDVARGAALFPLVGAAIGALTGAVALLLAHQLDPLIAAGLAIAIETALTGALHLDALADAADGLGGQTRDDTLRIMRDHTIGAYGASALVFNVLVRVAALAALLGHSRVVVVAMGAGALARGASLPLAALMPYARSGEGTGRSITLGITRLGALTGVVIALAAAAWSGPIRGSALLAGACVAMAIGARLSWTRLRGVTGDTLGATSELAQTLALVGALAAW